MWLLPDEQKKEARKSGGRVRRRGEGSGSPRLEVRGLPVLLEPGTRPVCSDEGRR